MPIRFRGPVRPRKLKSPDPINIPTVRDNKASRVRSDVEYFKANGEMPSVTSKWSSMSVYFQIPGHTASGGVDSVDVNGDVMAIMSSATNTIYIFKKDVNGEYQQTDTTAQSQGEYSGIYLMPAEGKVVYAAPQSGGNEGRLVAMNLDFSTGVLDQASRTVYQQSTARDGSYDGRGITRIGNTIFSGAPGYYLSRASTRGGLLTFRDITTGARKALDVSYLGGLNESNSYVFGNRIYNEDGFFANTLASDGNRLLVLAPGAATSNTADSGYISVFDYDDANQTLTEIQKINNPAMPQYAGTQASIRAVAALNGKMLALLNVGGPDNDYDPLRTSLVEYTWDGSAYIQSGWSDVELSSDWAANSTDSVIAHMTMLSDTELLIPGTGISGGKIYKVTK